MLNHFCTQLVVMHYDCEPELEQCLYGCMQAVSVAQLQGHFMLHRHDPIKAVLSADFRRQEAS